MKFRNEKGFTLIELIVVIVIIAILAMVAIPKWLGLNDAAQTAACKQIQSEIVTAANVGYANSAIAGKPEAYPASIEEMVENNLLDEMPECPNKAGYYIYNSQTGTVRCVLEKHMQTDE